LLGYLATYNPHLSDLTLALREVVLEEAPDAVESISRGYALAIGFSFTGNLCRMGCCVVTYETHVSFGFNRGALLADPNGIRAGTGKLICLSRSTIRTHWNIRRFDDTFRQLLNRSAGQRIDAHWRGVRRALTHGGRRQKAH